MTQIELVYWCERPFTKRKIVAATISLPVKMLVAQTLTSGWGCRCEVNTNVPGAPRILDPPLIAEENFKNLTDGKFTVEGFPCLL